jgi:hypothetical protein
MGHVVRIDQHAVSVALQARSQRPFLDVLARVLGAGPDPSALREFASRHPDRWAHAVAIIAGLAGYSSGGVTDASVGLRISRMSDAELERRLAEVEGQLKPR